MSVYETLQIDKNTKVSCSRAACQTLVPPLLVMITMKRLLSILLIFCFATSAFAEGNPGFLEDFSRVAVDNAAGWGAIGTPMILMTAGTFHEYLQSQRTGEGFDGREVFGFLGESNFWHGLLGCVALTYVASIAVPMLPFGPVLSTMLRISAGFVGAELGMGTFGRANWTSISLQVIAATAGCFAFKSLLTLCGIAAGGALLPFLTATVSIMSALSVAFVLDKNGSKEAVISSHEGIDSKGRATVESPPSDFSESEWHKDYGKSYRNLLMAGQKNNPLEVHNALQDFRQASSERQLARCQ